MTVYFLDSSALIKRYVTDLAPARERKETTSGAEQ